MPAPTILTQGLTNPVALRIAPAAGRAVVALRDGRLLAIDLVDGITSELALLPEKISAFDLAPDGQTAYVAGPLLGLWQVPLDGSTPVRLARRLVRPGAVAIDGARSAIFVVEGASPGRLLRLEIAPAGGSVVGRRLRAARGLVVEAATGRTIVAEAARGGRLVEPRPTDRPAELVGGLGSPVDLAWADAAESALLVGDKAGGRVLHVDPDQPGAAPVELLTGLTDLWAARLLAPDQLLIGDGDQVLVAAVPVIAPDPVVMRVPGGELFISGWVSVGVALTDPTLTLDEVDFLVEPAESGALVSLARDNGFDPNDPTILLSAGWQTGEHHLVALRHADGSELGRTRFEVLDTWLDPDLGPSIATFGAVVSGPDSATWGGPDSGDFTVPQNVAVYPALGTRNVGVVLIDTTSARYPTGAALTTIINNLQDQVVNGVLVGGQNRSVATYFDQASNGLFGINLVGIAGPIALPNAWGSYFTMDGNGDWIANADLPATVIAELVRQNRDAAAAGNPPVLDLSQIDSIVYVARSVTATPPAADRFVWPRASLSTETQIIGTVDLGIFGIELPVFRGIARIFMPDDWEARDTSNRRFHETLAHELGHNLGIVDQYEKSAYSTDAKARITGQTPTGVANGSWELMAWEENLPLPSAAHRLMLGWLDPARIRLYNFGVFGPIDDTITLHAASAGAAPAGRYGAAEVRVEDGLNLYFEYRPATAGRIVDAAPPDASAVLGTEALTREQYPADRAQILLVEEDTDTVVERGSFTIGQDFRDRDTSSPGFENEFIVDVTATTADTATLRVRYAPDSKPDPRITPWSPSTNWQSPDLEITNGRSQADPSFRNVPWEGHDNTITARVSNNGSSDAHAVTVEFFAKDFTFGGGAETSLGSQTLDVPTGGVPVTFTAPQAWRPAQLVLPFPFFNLTYQQHACVVARIAPFLDPVTGIWEVTPENNEAQSNYTWMASTTASPASREATVLIAENTLDQPAIVSFTVRQPHPLFRVYLDHRWVRLQPGERRPILLMVESLLGDPRFASLVEEFPHRERRIETTLRLSAYGDTGETCTQELLGGAAVLAITGIGTRFEWFESDGGVARGRVVQTEDGSGVDGPILVTVLPRDPGDPTPELVREAEVVGGDFVVELGRAGEAIRVQAHYLGRFPWTPCDSEVVEL